MSDEIKNGDVVRLRSGGPAMTVYNADSQDDIGCSWWQSGDYHTNDCFAACELVIIKTEESAAHMDAIALTAFVTHVTKS